MTNTLRFLALSTVMAMGCAGTAGETVADGEVLVGADETASISSELTGGVALGSTLKTTANLNLRTGAGTGYQVRLVIPQGATVTTVNRTTPSGAFYNVKYNGVTGWASGAYLTLVSSGGGTTTPGTSVRDAAIARAKGGVGFSYWWGHGAWVPNGLTSSNGGTCQGDCPNCSHRGSYGADCSGYVAKVWHVPSTNTSMSTDSHPYGTIHFVGSNSLWSTVSRSNVIKGDALVYNTNGSGHILIYESGDAWGSVWAYEARGCSYGIVHNLRSVTSEYKGIRRAGW